MSDIEQYLRRADQERIAYAINQTGADGEAYLAQLLPQVAGLRLKERLALSARTILSLLPGQLFPDIADQLDDAAPHVSGFAGMVFPEATAVAGTGDPERALKSLRWQTRFSSSEFAVRPFLMADLDRGLSFLLGCADDENDHVRRWASEGSRPKLPWAPDVPAIKTNPLVTASILSHLCKDSSKYVRTSVANHLNDISKIDPNGLFGLIGRWDINHPHTRWIIGHGLRSLVKQGEPRALEMLGFDPEARINVQHFAVTPATIKLGGKIEIAATLDRPDPDSPLIIDYRIDYASKTGRPRRKVFKGLVVKDQRSNITFCKAQHIKDLSTRHHVTGMHKVALLVNGREVAQDCFHLID